MILLILHNVDDLSLRSVFAGLVVLVELWLGRSVAKSTHGTCVLSRFRRGTRGMRPRGHALVKVVFFAAVVGATLTLDLVPGAVRVL